MSQEVFTWIPAYEAIADALLARKYNRGEVLSVFAEITGDDERANTTRSSSSPHSTAP